MRHPDTAPLLEMYRPHLLRLEGNLIAAVFPLMKVYPAEFCIRCSLADGAINEQTLIVESSSGTMALGLALVCNWIGLQLAIVTDYACDAGLQRRLEDLGTSVERVLQPNEIGGYQRARLERLEAIRQQRPSTFWINQYDNQANPGSYSSLAAQLVEQIGQFDCLIGTVGSGGSVCGTANYLRVLYPELYVIGIDTFNSVLFGQADGCRKLRGLGNSILPGNLDHTAFNEVHWVSAAAAYSATRVLHRSTGLFRGGTSGAAWLVARHWAKANPDKRAVCLFPDDGHRYINDIYNDVYLQDNGLRLQVLPERPFLVDRPGAAVPEWSMIQWNRRSLVDFTGEAGIRDEHAIRHFSGKQYDRDGKSIRDYVPRSWIPAARHHQ